MKTYQVVLDTNVLLTALRSKKGASYKLLTLIDSGRFKINLSVPLVLEYEDILKRDIPGTDLSNKEIDNILDYICKIANKREIFYLWRPFLKDPKDDFILELAVESKSDFIITFNLKNFAGIDKFGIKAITPKYFLKIIGEI